MRKPDEVALYAALRARSTVVNEYVRSPGDIMALEDEAKRLGIHEKRAFTLVGKWCDKGWWDYGVTLRSGWFTPTSPETLEGKS